MTNIAKNMTIGMLKIRIYTSELNALKSFIPSGLYGVEIGIGTGRIAVALKLYGWKKVLKSGIHIMLNRLIP